MGTRLILRERLENRVRKTFLPFAANAIRSEKAAAVSSRWCRTPEPNQRNGFQLPSVWEQIAENARATRSLGSLNVGTNTAEFRNVEVRVAGGEAHALEKERRRHGQLNDVYFWFRLPAVPLASAPNFLRAAGSFLTRVFLATKDDSASIHKAAQIIDVTVRVVPCDSFAEPYNVFHAEVSSQRRSVCARSNPDFRTWRF